MMTAIPVVSSRELIAYFKKKGFLIARQQGSHVIMYKDGILRPITIPHPRKESRIKVIESNLKSAGISKKDFIEGMRGKKR